jgi:hypothetical protein
MVFPEIVFCPWVIMVVKAPLVVMNNGATRRGASAGG